MKKLLLIYSSITNQKNSLQKIGKMIKVGKTFLTSEQLQ